MTDYDHNNNEESSERGKRDNSRQDRRSSSSSRRPPGNRRRRFGRRSIYCPKGKCFDYKNIDTLKQHITETGKIKPRRQTRNCARCQRELGREVKRARHLALLPFVGNLYEN